MKRIVLLVLSLFCVLVFVGCNEEPNKEVEDKTGVVTEETWNDVVKNLGFLKDDKLSYTATIYTGDINLNEPDMRIEKDGLLFKVTSLFLNNNKEYSAYLDFRNTATTHMIEDYQKYDIDGEDWYIFDADYSFEMLFAQLGFYEIVDGFSSCTYENGMYKGKGLDEDKLQTDVSYKFENGRLVEYCQYDGTECDYLFKVDSFDTTRVKFPEAHHFVDMTYEEMGKYVSYVTKTLESYKAIGVEELVTYENLITADAIFLRGTTSEGEPREASAIREEIRKLFLENYFRNLTITEETSTDTMWVGKIEGTTRKVLFTFDDEEPVYFSFNILEDKIIDVYNFISYMRSQYTDTFFTYEGYSFFPCKDAFSVTYAVRTIGTFNDVLTAANEKVDEYGDLEWSSSAASDYDHFDYYENDDMAVELLFLDGGRENVYILYITVCVSFTDLPAGDILGYGFENPLFR